MNRINITTCPVCGGTELKQEMTCVDHCATGETFQLWRCAGCGFLFTQDFPADDSMDDYYDAPAYISHTDTWQGIVNTTYHLVRAFMLRRKARRSLKEEEKKIVLGSYWSISRRIILKIFGFQIWPDCVT